MKSSGTIEVSSTLHEANGLAFWIDWEFQETIALTTGPISSCQLDEYIEWDKASKQAVYFLEQLMSKNKIINYELEFTNSGELFFRFPK